MKLLPIALGLSLVLVAGPALARDNCHVPQEKWQPKEKLQALLEKQGWKVRQIKTWNGCYEAYAVNDKGQRMETFFMPDTFAVSPDQREF